MLILETLSFNFSVGMGGAGCGNSFSGTATVGANTLTGTFSGHDCAGVVYNNGMMSWSLATGRATSESRNVAGRWSGAVPTAIGGGTWTWQISPVSGDIYGGTITGTISVANNSLPLTNGTFTGTVTTRFPGPNTNVFMMATFAGACPATMNANTAFDIAGNVLGGSVAGSTCNGSFAAAGLFDIRR